VLDNDIEDVVMPRTAGFDGSHSTKLSDPTPAAVLRLEDAKTNQDVAKKIAEYQALIARIDAAVPYMKGDSGKALKMHYYEDKSLRQIMGTLHFAHKSSVWRCIQRGIDELMMMLNL